MRPDRYDGMLAAIIVLFLATAITAMAQKSLTNDELAHIPAGYSYLKTGDYRMNAEHPPLLKLLAGVFLLPLDSALPLDHPSWAARKEWVFGDRFFFQANNNPDQLLFWARMPIIFIGALLILFAYIWARALYGPWAGIVAAFFIALDPLITAMSSVVHTDIGITAFGFIATYFFWRFCTHRTWTNLGLCALFLGFAFAAKYTGLYFILILGVLAVLTAWHKGNRGASTIWNASSLNLYALTGLIFLIAAFIFAATYRFTQLGWFIQGMRDVSLHSILGHNAYLYGTFSDIGFWYYFPLAFLVKTPLPTILLIITALILGLATLINQHRTKQDHGPEARSNPPTDPLHHHNAPAAEWFLLLPALIYLALFMINRINIGLRHILPIYPFLIVYASHATTRKSKIIPAIFIVLAAWLAWNAYAIYPDHLANFNELAGGPDNGHRWLIDSNIDWGQDLKGLGEWLGERGNPNILIAYFGHDDRDYRNISWSELKCGPQPGLIAISVNRLIGFNQEDSKCSAWLRSREPIAKIGYSIFIYNITESSIIDDRESYCADKCREKCKAEKQIFIGSAYKDKCKCECAKNS